MCTRSHGGHLRTHGHLPASVSAHLAPLLDSQQITVTAQLVPTTVDADDQLDRQQQHTVAAAADVSATEATEQGNTAQSETPAVTSGSRQGSTSNTAKSGSSSGASTLARMGSGTWKVKLQILVSSSAAADASSAVDVSAAVELAASAGSDSLEPGKNSGAVLSSAFQHVLQQTR